MCGCPDSDDEEEDDNDDDWTAPPGIVKGPDREGPPIREGAVVVG